MKLKFKHVLGKVANADFYYSPVSATFTSDEFEEAVNTGWLVNEYSDDGDWFQSRVVRINLQRWKDGYSVTRLAKAKKKAGVIVSNFMHLQELSQATLEKMDDLWEEYIDKKKFLAPLPWRSLLDHSPKAKRVITFRDQESDALIGFTLVRGYIHANTLCSLQFVWGYDNPARELGKLSQMMECLMALDAGYDYLNLCSAYEATCMWKADLDGFEWWDGEFWRRDKSAFEALCLRDTSISNIGGCLMAESQFDSFKEEADVVTA